MRSFCLLTSMEMNLIPNCSLLHYQQFGKFVLERSSSYLGIRWFYQYWFNLYFLNRRWQKNHPNQTLYLSQNSYRQLLSSLNGPILAPKRLQTCLESFTVVVNQQHKYPMKMWKTFLIIFKSRLFSFSRKTCVRYIARRLQMFQCLAATHLDCGMGVCVRFSISGAIRLAHMLFYN